MMQKPVYIVDEIEAVVSAVSAKLTPNLQLYDSLITGVHYDYGHPLEIINTLAEKDATQTFKFKRFPLIALFQDFKEGKGDVSGIYSKVRLNMIIANSTMPQYKSKDRYAKNFKPILYPIYHEFLYQIYKSKSFINKSPNFLPHVKIDRVFWGKEGLYGSDGNIFNDYIDCIEIKDLELSLYEKNC